MIVLNTYTYITINQINELSGRKEWGTLTSCLVAATLSLHTWNEGRKIKNKALDAASGQRIYFPHNLILTFLSILYFLMIHYHIHSWIQSLSLSHFFFHSVHSLNQFAFQWFLSLSMFLFFIFCSVFMFLLFPHFFHLHALFR